MKILITRSPKTLPDPGPGNRWAKVLTHPEHAKLMGLPILNLLDTPPAVEARVPSIPDVFQRTIASGEQNPVTLTEPIQKWMYDRFHECAPRGLPETELRRCWNNTWMSSKAFTNGTGPDKIDEATNTYLYADWINGTGLDKKGFKLWATICRGALVKVTDEAFWGGEQRVQIQVMDVLDPKTRSITYTGNEWLFSPAVSWNRMWLNGVPNTHDPRWPYGRANPFPYFGDDRRTLVPVPLLGHGVTVSYLPREWIRYLDEGEPYPPNYYWENFPE